MKTILFFLTIFFLFQSVSISYADIYSQKSPYGEGVGTTATGGSIGVTPTTAAGVEIGTTEKTATGVTMGVTTQPNPNIGRPLSCLEVGGRQLCGSEAIAWCNQYPQDQTCQKIISGLNLQPTPLSPPPMVPTIR